MDAAGQYALAYSLTTTAGVRAVLSLALVAVATHVGLLHPPALFAWLGAPLAMWALLAVAAAELLGDKIPLLDHALHVLQIVVKPAAAAIIVGGTVHPQSNDMLIFLMVIGALNALGVHAGVMTVRGASTLTTGGLANPVVSTVEDAGTIGTVALAFVAPVLAAMLSICAVVLLLRIARPIKRNANARQQERETVAR
ncbi:MAG TPA: DUF4126 domain-containing protein [Candidatus Baltobacteraceae bacterium]|nr:DUF4126 domain-containing protein [Candidatus Baltobacteraceae bacterium]